MNFKKKQKTSKIVKRRNRERYFTSKLTKSLNNKTSFAWKLPDLSTGIKPFDIFCVINGKPMAIECKMKKVKTIRKPQKYLTKHQEHFLRQFKNAGGNSYIVFFDHAGKMEIYELDSYKMMGESLNDLF